MRDFTIASSDLVPEAFAIARSLGSDMSTADAVPVPRANTTTKPDSSPAASATAKGVAAKGWVDVLLMKGAKWVYKNSRLATFLAIVFCLLLMSASVESFFSMRRNLSEILTPNALGEAPQVVERSNQLRTAIVSCAGNEDAASTEVVSSVDLALNGLRPRSRAMLRELQMALEKLEPLASALQAAPNAAARSAICSAWTGRIDSLASQIARVSIADDNLISKQHAARASREADAFGILAALMCALVLIAVMAVIRAFKLAVDGNIKVEESTFKVMQAETLKLQFLSMASHELSSPLHSLINTLNSVRRAGVVTDGDANWISLMDVGNLLRERAQDIADYVHLTSGRMIPRMVRFVPGVVIATVLRELEEQLYAKNLDVEWDEQPSLMQPVESDSGRFRQIVTNLYSNAIKYTPEGTITISGDLDDATGILTLSVSDTGAGIDARDREAIFEPFARLPSAPEAKGHGLGLAIVKHIAMVLDGTIALQTELGQGSTFTVRIPVKVPKAQPGTPLEPQATDRGILIVEDNMRMREFLTDALRQRGWAVTPVENVKSAKLVMQSTPFRFAITDHDLPDGTGVHVAQALRQVNPSAKIMLVTANLLASSQIPKDLFDRVGNKGEGYEPLIEQLEEMIAPKSS